MNTALYRLAEFTKTTSIKALSDCIDQKNYNSLKWKLQRQSLKLNNEEKKLIAEWLDNRIRELVKIKLLVDKEIEW